MVFQLRISDTPETLPTIILVSQREFLPYVAIGGLLAGDFFRRNLGRHNSSFKKVLWILKTPTKCLVGKLQ